MSGILQLHVFHFRLPLGLSMSAVPTGGCRARPEDSSAPWKPEPRLTGLAVPALLIRFVWPSQGCARSAL